MPLSSLRPPDDTVNTTAMSKAAFWILLVVVSSNAQAEEWVAVNRNEYATGYAYPATLIKQGNLARMWSLVDCKTISNFIGGPPFMSIKSHEEFDCQTKKLRTLAYSLHSEKMGGGEVVLSDTTPGQWEPVLPGSQIELFWNLACGKK